MQAGIVFLFLAPYAVAVVMPSWRWLLVYAVVLGGLLTAWFAGIPAAPIISIFLGPHPTDHEYNFAIPPSLRDFCALTEIGKHSIPANKISIRPGLAPHLTAMTAPAFCVSPAAWASGLCTEIDQA